MSDLAGMTKLETELLRGSAALAVMKLLERRAMYGYEIVEALAKRTDGVLSLGQSTLYPLLYNLEAKGLIEASWEKSESGRDRKYYALTTQGQRKLKADTAQWTALVGAMAALGLGRVDRALRSVLAVEGIAGVRP